MRESFAHRIVEFSVKHPWIVITACAALSVFMGYHALQIRVDADIFSMIPRKAEVIEDIETYSSNWDTGQILIVVESGELFELEALQALSSAIDQLEAEADVLGSINPFNFITFARRGGGVHPVTASANGRAPESREELQRFEELLLADPLARNMVLSADGRAFCAIFPVAMHGDYGAVMETVERLRTALQRHYTVYISGAPVFLHTTKTALLADVPRFLLLSVLVILAILYLSFRSLRSLGLPLIVVGMGTLWTMGTMHLLGFELTVISIMVPPLVLTLGNAYSIHILNQYYREARTGDRDRSWVARSVGRINQTILLAAVTSIIGFSSLAAANLSQIREFGLSASIGILYCAALSLLFFPAVLRLLPAPMAVERDRVLRGWLTRFMERLAAWVIGKRIFILIASALVLIGFAFTVGRITYRTDYMSYYRERQRLIRESREIVERFGGYSNAYVTVQAPAGQPNYFLRPDVLRTIAAFEERLSEEADISYLFSFTQHLQSMNLKLGGGFAIPDGRAPILLLSRYMRAIMDSAYGRSMAAQPVNPEFTRFTIYFRTWNAETGTLLMEPEFKRLMGRIESLVEEHLDVGSEQVIWGRSLALLYISETLSRDQLVSVVVSLCLIALVTSIGFRSLRLGLLTLIPIVTGIMLNFIIMAAAGLPFDVVTVMFCSVAIGVGIDDSIHLLIRYRRRQRARGGVGDAAADATAVLTHVLKTAGRPIVLTSLSLISGLLVFCFSRFLPILYFGCLVSVALITTTVGALVLLPAILSFGPQLPTRGRRVDPESPTRSAHASEEGAAPGAPR